MHCEIPRLWSRLQDGLKRRLDDELSFFLNFFFFFAMIFFEISSQKNSYFRLNLRCLWRLIARNWPPQNLLRTMFLRSLKCSLSIATKLVANKDSDWKRQTQYWSYVKFFKINLGKKRPLWRKGEMYIVPQIVIYGVFGGILLDCISFQRKKGPFIKQ